MLSPTSRMVLGKGRVWAAPLTFCCCLSRQDLPVVTASSRPDHPGLLLPVYNRGHNCCPRPLQAGHHQQSTSRLYHRASVRLAKRSLFSRMFNAWKDVLTGDDHINPKKILERKYLYFALLATHFRKLRLSHNSRNNDDAGVSASDADDNDSSINNALYDQTVAELEGRKLETITNVDLRRELQGVLQEQVQTAFATFRKVDDVLGIPYEDVLRMDLAQMKDIFVKDLETTQALLKSTSSLTDGSPGGFLETKLEALQLLSGFHGWATPVSNSATATTTSATTTNATASCAASEEREVDAFGMELSGDSYRIDETLRRIRYYQTLNLCRSALIREELGYSVLALRSGIPNAGRGLFVDGSAMAGCVLAFQPGDVWPKEHLITDAPDVVAHFDDGDDEDCQVLLRFDDYVVDARQSPVTVLSQEGSMNPWAVGHMANHPEAGVLPNCQSTMLNYYSPPNKNRDYGKYVPNTYARVPSWKSKFFEMGDDTLMHGLCLLAKRDVKNEELVCDYRLQSESVPNWYNVVLYNDGLDQEQVVFFRDDWKKPEDR
jgi:acetolactate synthase small subunit